MAEGKQNWGHLNPTPPSLRLQAGCPPKVLRTSSKPPGGGAGRGGARDQGSLVVGLGGEGIGAHPLTRPGAVAMATRRCAGAERKQRPGQEVPASLAGAGRSGAERWLPRSGPAAWRPSCSSPTRPRAATGCSGECERPPLAGRTPTPTPTLTRTPRVLALQGRAIRLHAARPRAGAPGRPRGRAGRPAPAGG